ncbi:hypothetical protein CPTD_01619 [Corynebacterium pseudotuberculosis]|nr:hypothetical protein CPTD_01619 [Corynebacterium pseudotuberculosis]
MRELGLKRLENRRLVFLAFSQTTPLSVRIEEKGGSRLLLKEESAAA